MESCNVSSKQTVFNKRSSITVNALPPKDARVSTHQKHDERPSTRNSLQSFLALQKIHNHIVHSIIVPTFLCIGFT